MMWKDPIVEEVRAIREKLWREWKASPGGIAQRQREIFDQWKGRKVRSPDELYVTDEEKAHALVADPPASYEAGKK